MTGDLISFAFVCEKLFQFLMVHTKDFLYSLTVVETAAIWGFGGTFVISTRVLRLPFSKSSFNSSPHKFCPMILRWKSEHWIGQRSNFNWYVQRQIVRRRLSHLSAQATQSSFHFGVNYYSKLPNNRVFTIIYHGVIFPCSRSY